MILLLIVLIAGIALGVVFTMPVVWNERARVVDSHRPELNADEVRAIIQAAQESLVDVEPFVAQIMEMKPKALPKPKPVKKCTVRLDGGEVCNARAVKKAIVNFSDGVAMRYMCELHCKQFKSIIKAEVELDEDE